MRGVWSTSAVFVEGSGVGQQMAHSQFTNLCAYGRTESSFHLPLKIMADAAPMTPKNGP